jgi:hypothetical protein
MENVYIIIIVLVIVLFGSFGVGLFTNRASVAIGGGLLTIALILYLKYTIMK